MKAYVIVDSISGLYVQDFDSRGNAILDDVLDVAMFYAPVDYPDCSDSDEIQEGYSRADVEDTLEGARDAGSKGVFEVRQINEDGAQQMLYVEDFSDYDPDEDLT